MKRCRESESDSSAKSLASAECRISGKIRVTQSVSRGGHGKTPLHAQPPLAVLRGMKRFLLLFFVLVLPAWSAEEKGFSESLSAADFKAAGLDKLSAEERAKLDALVAAGDAPPTEPAAAVKPKPEIIRGKIAGVLSGWKEGTVLVFEDGQRWQVLDKGTYRAAPVRRSPTVELFPLSTGDYVMTINSVPRRAVVKRVTE